MKLMPFLAMHEIAVYRGINMIHDFAGILLDII